MSPRLDVLVPTADEIADRLQSLRAQVAGVRAQALRRILAHHQHVEVGAGQCRGPFRIRAAVETRDSWVHSGMAAEVREARWVQIVPAGVENPRSGGAGGYRQRENSQSSKRNRQSKSARTPETPQVHHNSSPSSKSPVQATL